MSCDDHSMNLQRMDDAYIIVSLDNIAKIFYSYTSPRNKPGKTIENKVLHIVKDLKAKQSQQREQY